MGNCCRSPAAAALEDIPTSAAATITSAKGAAKSNGVATQILASKSPPIESKFLIDCHRELGRGEFGITYLCSDRGDPAALFACKSISKRKLRTAVDVDDVRREVSIMKHLPPDPSIVTLREEFEDEKAVHLVMELCDGGELFDRIVARGHYNERAAAAAMKTIVEVVMVCHRHGVIHRDLKPENFLFASRKESSP